MLAKVMRLHSDHKLGQRMSSFGQHESLCENSSDEKNN